MGKLPHAERDRLVCCGAPSVRLLRLYRRRSVVSYAPAATANVVGPTAAENELATFTGAARSHADPAARMIVSDSQEAAIGATDVSRADETLTLRSVVRSV